MTQDEYWYMRILLDKWTRHKDHTLPNPFDGVQVANRAGMYIGKTMLCMFMTAQCSTMRCTYCDVSCIDGGIENGSR